VYNPRPEVPGVAAKFTIDWPWKCTYGQVHIEGRDVPVTLDGEHKDREAGEIVEKVLTCYRQVRDRIMAEFEKAAATRFLEPVPNNELELARISIRDPDHFELTFGHTVRYSEKRITLRYSAMTDEVTSRICW
jgi:hypothetical protein